MAESSEIPSSAAAESTTVSSANLNATPEKHPESSARNASCVLDKPRPSYLLFNRQRSVHELFGGGLVADVLLWKRRSLSIATIVSATAAWYMFQYSGYTSLSLVATILLLLVAILFIWANAATLLQRPPPPLPELELSEEMVNNIASSFCVRINNALAVAHDIAIGKDVKLFLKAVVFLWLFSIFGNWFSFLTLAYLGLLFSITIPAIYSKYEEQVDRTIGRAREEIEKQFKNLDSNVLSKIPVSLPKQKTQ